MTLESLNSALERLTDAQQLESLSRNMGERRKNQTARESAERLTPKKRKPGTADPGTSGMRRAS